MIWWQQKKSGTINQFFMNTGKQEWQAINEGLFLYSSGYRKSGCNLHYA